MDLGGGQAHPVGHLPHAVLGEIPLFGHGQIQKRHHCRTGLGIASDDLGSPGLGGL